MPCFPSIHSKSRFEIKVLEIHVGSPVSYSKACSKSSSLCLLASNPKG